ncbi:GGDEF domain-containing protein [Salinimonas chungwhensis]|uniref:GGDEF domain-containing protein n=1 Tax=Salinimonas chungwhensis TaxID=265425 RepID=UPI000362F94F|nr:diguanylate cyclase [Salinimonas chungwhensis]
MTNKQLQMVKQQHSVLTQFIIRLSLFYQGYSKDIDDELKTLRSHLGGAANFSLAHVSINKLNRMLQDDVTNLEHFKADCLNDVEQAAKTLMAAINKNDDAFAELVSSVGQTRQPMGSLYELVRLCLRVTDIFSHVALTSALKKNKTLRSVPQPHPATARQTHKPDRILLYLQEELAQLLNSYLAKQPDNPQISELKEKVREGLTTEELLNICLAILRLVVKDSMQEATFSGKVMQSLHRSLGNLHQNMNESLDLTQKTFDTQRRSAIQMHDQIQRIEKNVARSESGDTITHQAQAQLRRVGNELQQRAQDDHQAQEILLRQLEQMKEQISQLESKTRYYRNKLARQVATSQTDPLTRLPNRQAYNDHLTDVLKSPANKEQSLCLAVIDIDHFKSINDRFGHAAGDKTLQVIGNHLRQALDADDFLARWGGEEFVLVMPRSGHGSLKQKLDRLRTGLTKIPFKFKQERLTITASFGGTCFSAGENPDDVFERADSLLYQAKRSGRNCVVIDQDDVE